MAGSDQGTCLCWAQRTQSRVPQRPQTPAPKAGEKTAKGKCPKEQGPSSASCALQKSEGARRVGCNSPLVNLPLGGEEGNAIGVGHSPRLSGPAIPAPAAGPHLAGSPVDREEKEGPQGSEGEIELGATTFSGQKAGGLRPRAYAAPVEWVPSGIARVWGTREETRSSRGADLDQAGDTVGQLSAGGGQGTGERGPPGTPRLASRIPRLEPRAPRPVPRVLPACRASCISRAPRRPWSWKWGATTWWLLQPARGSEVRGPSSNPAGPGRRRPRDWGSGAPPSSLPLHPSSPFCSPQSLYLPLSGPIVLCPPLSFALHLSPHPSSLAFLPPLLSRLPSPPGGAELLPSLLDNAVAARPLLPRPQVGAWAASASSGLRMGGGVERRG